ncbi:adenylate/guanylate cyclase domain-containing protein [Gracilinema caldarium]|uniref:Adenylate/guanylate cyclase n=1 Tax=Gracilinema caldarium (strain ATCC 51460 / DSM 7334 / H1) TaxID=744872 RepID=F8EZ67_GRAC1|nr:adenylate/guanylate cyclase domain-containing protein [Gracilinema caldarium]AEJ19659.1 adenylate/guanylate cyclase [Gracilinema caldarium DSM 7334]
MIELVESKEVIVTVFSSALIGCLATIEMLFSVFYVINYFVVPMRRHCSRFIMLLLSVLFMLFTMAVVSPLFLHGFNGKPLLVQQVVLVLLSLLLAQETALGLFIISSRATKFAMRSSSIIGVTELLSIIAMWLCSPYFTIPFFAGIAVIGCFILFYGVFIVKNREKNAFIFILLGVSVLLSAFPYILLAAGLFPLSFESHLFILVGQILLFSCFFIFILVGNPSLAPEEPYLSDYVDRVSIALTRFIPKEFLQILDKPSVVDLQLGDHVKQEMTIFFSDIRQFTNLSEVLTPEESFKFINSYLARIVPAITNHGGFVDKYMGDAIMALFPDEKGPDAAVRSAIDMQRVILEYNIHRAKCNYRPLSMGIGLHTGPLMLGVVGVQDRMQNTVISDAVNLASRLESITKVFNISIAISDETFKSLKDPGAYMYRFIGKVRVKGKEDPVSVFEIYDGLDPQLLEHKMKANSFFEQGMMSYYQKDFNDAMYQFRKVLEIIPEDGAAIFYLDNCMMKVRA